MTITSANDINRLYNVNSDAVRNSLYSAAADSAEQKNENLFGSILDAAVNTGERGIEMDDGHLRKYTRPYDCRRKSADSAQLHSRSQG